MKEGEDFPDLRCHSSVFMKNNIVLFGGKDSNMRNNIFHIFNLKTNEWSKKELKGESDSIPQPRTRHTANAVGGYNIGPDKNVYKIDFDTQKCQIIGEIKHTVSGHTSDFYNGSIYIIGGESMKSEVPKSVLQKFSLQTNKCEEIELTGQRPKRILGHKSIILQDSLYLFGGFGNFNDMFSVNLTNNASTKIDQHRYISSPRSDFSFFAFEDKLYLFGGNSNLEYYQDFYSFDLKSQNWEQEQIKNQKHLPKRAKHSTVAVKESKHQLKVYLVGGWKSNNTFQKNMNVIALSNNRIYWVLHYLESTGIRNKVGLNMIQEIIEMLE